MHIKVTYPISHTLKNDKRNHKIDGMFIDHNATQSILSVKTTGGKISFRIYHRYKGDIVKRNR